MELDKLTLHCTATS